MSITPATCATEQDDRTAMKVLRCVYMVAASGREADFHEVRDLLILCFSMTAVEAEAAIADTATQGLVSFEAMPQD